ncbi:proteobacterial dedicated sortase system response regulator [endosymbiont of Riftia pachyptila]|nr:proteobacterial dedicated sortase system response regulator [endosymbiont of Riftia pachyptila]
MPKLIAIVEDEPAIRDNYTDYLTRQGYRVNGYASRQAASSAFGRQLPDLVILDIGLQDEPDAGFELCRELRSRSANLPIIFLTARDDEFDTVSGLRLGADDYLTKSISLPQIAARIAALFRRLDALQTQQSSDNILTPGSLRLDLDRLTAHWREQPVELTLTEFWMVHALARHPGHVRSRDQLMEEANILVDAASVSTHIKRIRQKFQQLDAGFSAIDAVYGAGYRWLENGQS